MAKKPKELAGVLIYYFATGESGRAQFIGNNSMDDKGLIKGYEEIYDIQIGDKIQLLHPSFSTEWLLIRDDSYEFMQYLTAMWHDPADLKANIRPYKNHLSWGDVIAKDKKNSAIGTKAKLK